MKTLFLANNVYGKHGGPYDNGSALGLLFHLLSGGEGETQGFYGHVIGGMGAITQALASAAPQLRRQDPHLQSPSRKLIRAMAARAASFSKTAQKSAGRIVLSNADPKRTFLGLVESSELPDPISAHPSQHQNGRPLRESKFRSQRRAARKRNALASGPAASAPSSL